MYFLRRAGKPLGNPRFHEVQKMQRLGQLYGLQWHRQDLRISASSQNRKFARLSLNYIVGWPTHKR
jgi:hypothetical protein